MLSTLLIRNFVLIEEASLDFDPGFTALTGETGAGKTLLTQALGLLLGERATEDMVGPRAAEALVQAVFVLSRDQAEDAPEQVRELLQTSESEVIAVRRLGAGGKSRCFLNGMVVPRELLGDMLEGLVAFTAQQEHRRLLEAAYQRDLLDAYGGEDLVQLRVEYGAVWREWRELCRALTQGDIAREERKRERELLTFEVEELEAARLSVEEERGLAREQVLLARAEEITQACGQAAELLDGDRGGMDVAGLLHAARSLLSPLRGVDAELDGKIDNLTECAYAVEDVARGLRRFGSSVAVDPNRRQEVEQRLRLYADLGRKYGGSTDNAVHHLEAARARLELLVVEDKELEAVRTRVAELGAKVGVLAARLSAARRELAPRLEAAVMQELADLEMAGAQFEVSVTTDLEIEHLGEHGADAVEFLLSSNPGLPPRRLARVASGGELSRTLLAVKCATAGRGGRETLVFDEIDAGIGGHTALAVGEKLKQLGEHCQVIVITHLPQVAAYADRHYLIEKLTQVEEALTRLVLLDEEASLAELCRMLGAAPDDPGAREHARALRSRAIRG